MSDEGPQEPPRGRRARGSVDPGPDYPADQPRRDYPPPHYPEMVPGQRRRVAPDGSRGSQDYPAPPGNRGRLAGDPPPGAGRGSAPAAGPAPGYGPPPAAGGAPG